MSKIVCTLVLATAGFSCLHAGQPYALRKEIDIPMALGLWALKENSGARLAEMRGNARDPSQLNRSDIPAFDRWAIGFYSPRLSEMSSVVAGAELLVPVAVNLWDTYHHDTPWYGAVVDAIMLEEALTLSSSLSSYAKSIRLHATPLSYDPSVPDAVKREPQNASSFFSNHTTSAFTTAVFSAYTFQLRHPESKLVPWVWGGSLALATGVGSMRVLAGKHFPSDVLAGAAAGALCGYLVPKLHTLHSHAGDIGAPQREAKRVNWDLALASPEGTWATGPELQVHF
jgi:membrane-associated phospholipid phosphatase